MNKKSKIFVALIFLSLIELSAQRANNWLFGNNAGLNFSTTPPSTLTGNVAKPDCSSSISDVNGNLLFYTDGSTVWNAQHSAMANGTGLIGSYTAGQSAIIVPIPCDPHRYVIFHVTDYVNPGYLSYTVVDMTLNNGLGDVVSAQKNVSLGSGWTEKLCAYYNSAGDNYWVLTHKWNSDQFVAFSVSSTGIATQSVVSSIGSVHNCGVYSGAHDAMGQLTISKDGTKVLNALTCQDNFELFAFNSQTGVLSNSISIPGNGGNAWGTAFSPDNTKIYTNSIFGQSIYQYDISTYNASAIASSIYTVVTTGTGGYNFGYMELGPDNKLYIAKPSSYSLSVVNSPNSSGSSCNFSIAGQSLGVYSSSHGLPRIAYNIPNSNGSLMMSASPSATIPCTSQSVTLTAAGGASANSYTWSGPGIVGTYTGQSFVTGSSGVFTCSAPVCSGTVSSVQFTIFPPTSISVTANSTLFCAGNTVTLAASGFSTYAWTPGNSTAATLAVSPSVTTSYTVSSVVNPSCTLNSNITLSVLPLPVITISSSQPLLCAGRSVTLTATGASSFVWGSGSTSASIQVNPVSTTIYTLIGTNSNGCSSSASYTQQVHVCEGIEILDSVDPHLLIYPNPNAGCVRISSQQDLRLTLYNELGQVVQSLELNSANRHQVDLSGLSKGIYFMSYQNLSFTGTRKIVVTE